jgi:ABC-type transporter MlaC component
MKYVKGILGISSVFMLFYIIQDQRNQIKTLKETSSYKIDSLYDEVFNAKAEAGRYELTLEYFKEVHPKAAKQFEDYMTHETE